jgi:hypothetical protein
MFILKGVDSAHPARAAPRTELCCHLPFIARSRKSRQVCQSCFAPDYKETGINSWP